MKFIRTGVENFTESNKNENYLCTVEVVGKRRYKLSDINRILGKGEVAL
jgi:hypothetical protein